MIFGCSGLGDFGRVMGWVRSDVKSQVDGQFVAGGMRYALGIGVGCMECFGCMFVCWLNGTFDGQGVVCIRSDTVIGGLMLRCQVCKSSSVGRTSTYPRR